jgi:Helix-turn-helix domain
MPAVATVSVVPEGTSSSRRGYLDSYAVADMLDVSVHTVRSWRKRHLGPPYFKFEGVIRYRLDDVVAYRDRGRREA